MIFLKIFMSYNSQNIISLPVDNDPQESAAVSFLRATEVPEQWQPEAEEGQLAVDVLETDDQLMVVAPMAGTRPSDIELHLHNDFLTIRGKRQLPVEADEYFYKECFWGNFSRTIVLPVDVKSELIQAEYKNGVLTVRLPKMKARTAIPILVVDE